MQTSIYGIRPEGQILIGIGANLPSDYGSPLETCIAALESLGNMAINVVRQSRWYKSAPVPVSAQPWFINGVAAVDCALAPDALLGEIDALVRLVEILADHLRVASAQDTVGGGVEDVPTVGQHLQKTGVDLGEARRLGPDLV